uniref:Uncharacterized protein n=1 Tax=Acrobeloides nanus TaxID=290746 RepID=A0A914EC25_9BILA
MKTPSLLIGFNQYYELVNGQSVLHESTGFYCVSIQIGSMVGGEGQLPKNHSSKNSNYTIAVSTQQTNEDKELQNMVQKLQMLKTIGIMEDPAEDDDEIAIALFKNSI